MASRSAPRAAAGFTLIELMVVVAVVGVILTLAGPSFLNYLLVQRLKGTHAQIVTDLQYARSEAVGRNTLMRVLFNRNDTTSCYSIYTAPASNAVSCDCLRGPGSACTHADAREVRTVSVAASSRVRIGTPMGQATGFAFDPITGGIFSIPTDLASTPMNRFAIDTSIDAARALRVVINRAGRLSVCAPSGSVMQEPAC